VNDARFPREEKLKLRNRISHLFEHGRRFSQGPMQVLWMPSPWPLERGIQVLVGAPKRRFKLAVDRNRVKRLLREAYRLERGNRLEGAEPVIIGFLYQGKMPVQLSALRGHMAEAIMKVAAHSSKGDQSLA